MRTINELISKNYISVNINGHVRKSKVLSHELLINNHYLINGIQGRREITFNFVIKNSKINESFINESILLNLYEKYQIKINNVTLFNCLFKEITYLDNNTVKYITNVDYYVIN